MEWLGFSARTFMPVVLKPQHASESPGGVIHVHTAGFPHRVSVSLGRGQRICISNQFSGVVETAGLGTTL